MSEIVKMCVLFSLFNDWLSALYLMHFKPCLLHKMNCTLNSLSYTKKSAAKSRLILKYYFCYAKYTLQMHGEYFHRGDLTSCLTFI